MRRIYIHSILTDIFPLSALLVATAALLFIVLQHPPSYTIDIGTANDAPFIEKFFLPEIQGGDTFRWSEPVAELKLHGVSARPIILGLRINGDIRVQQKDREVYLNRGEQRLAVMMIQRGWRRYSVLLPAGATVGSAIATVPLQLMSTAYVHEHRDLGVPIDWASITSTTALPNLWIISLQRSLLFTGGLGGVAIVCWYIDRCVWGRRDRLKRSLIICIPVALCASIILFWAQRNPFTLSWFFPANLLIGCIVFVYLIPAWVQAANVLDAERWSAKHLRILSEWGVGESALSNSISSERDKQRGLVNKQLFWYILYFFFATIFAVIYWTRTREYEDATLQLLTSFNAFVPYQYRILVPAFVRVLVSFVPFKLHYVYIIITIASTFGVIIYFRKLMQYFVVSRFINVYALIILYPMLWNYSLLSIFFYPSDILAILLFIVGILCIIQYKWCWYYIIFILAAFNRETSCFLVFVYLFVMFRKQASYQFLIHITLQFMIWVVIKQILSSLFISNYGDRVFQFQGGHNWKWFTSILSFNPDALLSLMVFGGAWIFLPVNWNIQPLFFKRLILTAIPFLIGMSIVGLLPEARIYSELVPIVMAPVVYRFHVFINHHISKSGKYAA